MKKNREILNMFQQDTEALINDSALHFLEALRQNNETVYRARSRNLPSDTKEIVAAVMVSRALADTALVRQGTYYIHLAMSNPIYPDFPKRAVRIADNNQLGFAFELLNEMPLDLSIPTKSLYIHTYREEPTSPEYLSEILEDWIIYGELPSCIKFPEGA